MSPNEALDKVEEILDHLKGAAYYDAEYRKVAKLYLQLADARSRYPEETIDE